MEGRTQMGGGGVGEEAQHTQKAQQTVTSQKHVCKGHLPFDRCPDQSEQGRTQRMPSK